MVPRVRFLSGPRQQEGAAGVALRRQAASRPASSSRPSHAIRERRGTGTARAGFGLRRPSRWRGKTVRERGARNVPRRKARPEEFKGAVRKGSWSENSSKQNSRRFLQSGGKRLEPPTNLRQEAHRWHQIEPQLLTEMGQERPRGSGASERGDGGRSRPELASLAHPHRPGQRISRWSFSTPTRLEVSGMLDTRPSGPTETEG